MKARHWIATLVMGFTGWHLVEASPTKREAREQEKAFLKSNAERDGVLETRSGLQYEILKKGTASTEKVRGKHTIELHYQGALADGTVFDSSTARGRPISVRLWDVIPGWSEGLKLMYPGDKYRFYIPSRLAYGSEGTNVVPPYSPLIFEIEVLSLSQKKR